MRRYRRVFARRQRIRGLELSEQQHETRLQSLENGYTMLSRDYTRLNDAIVKISESLVQLVVIQEQNKSIMQCIERQSSTIDSLDRRLDAIEVHMPALLELRMWVLTGLGLIVSAVLMALVALVIK
jgi:predicted RNase H-like nuclease (RuvC/YqgF family)